ncbi:hypothetical protein K7432_012981 [Basidiobolus ranarum]|uniref:Uncharacterized protein n=1 Tax=Basidiobolus ranarum TaxID=34480 RepID=A0ABR2WK19_9FUNG
MRSTTCAIVCLMLATSQCLAGPVNVKLLEKMKSLGHSNFMNNQRRWLQTHSISRNHLLTDTKKFNLSKRSKFASATGRSVGKMSLRKRNRIQPSRKLHFSRKLKERSSVKTEIQNLPKSEHHVTKRQLNTSLLDTDVNALQGGKTLDAKVKALKDEQGKPAVDIDALVKRQVNSKLLDAKVIALQEGRTLDAKVKALKDNQGKPAVDIDALVKRQVNSKLLDAKVLALQEGRTLDAKVKALKDDQGKPTVDIDALVKRQVNSKLLDAKVLALQEGRTLDAKVKALKDDQGKPAIDVDALVKRQVVNSKLLDAKMTKENQL